MSIAKSQTLKPAVKKPVPREHGAWSLLLQPFAAAALLGKHWEWLLIPALLLVVLGFLIREPLTILARQRWAGHVRNAKSQWTVRWLVLEFVGILLCFLIAVQFLPLYPLFFLAGLAIALTVISVWFAVRNRQRSVGLQIVAVAGLGTSAFLAALASTREIPSWVWLLWGILTLHGVVSVFCVHARLKMRIAASRISGPDPRRPAIYATLAQFLAAVLAIAYGSTGLAIPIIFSALIHGYELSRLSGYQNTREPLARVGFRMLAVSISHIVITVAVLWRN